MKKDIHPKVNTDSVVTCACGNTFTTISTLPSITLEICGACHPFYTGQSRFVDTEKRIDKFQKKQKLAEEKKKQAEQLKKSKETKKAKTKASHGKSIKELLEQLKVEESK